MGNGYLWLLSSNGVPYRVTADNRIGMFNGVLAAFALDLNGNVFQFVLNSHLTIRRRVEIYANQVRLAGWSSRTLPTDRAAFSNEDGSNSGDMSGFQLKADGWRWEESWIVDVDVRKCDMEVSLLPKKGVSSFVRRRRWKRHMRYTSIEKWAELPREEKTTFVELAVGGFDLLPDRNCLLFALSKDGYVYRRVGIDGNNPGGDSCICQYRGKDLAKISCSASLGTLVVLTWDGRLFFRAGITRGSFVYKNQVFLLDCRNGTTWCPLLAPQNLPLAFISIGTRSMWVVSVDGKVRLLSRSLPFLDGYQFVAGVSDSGVVYVRDGVSPNEPAGRSFVRIVERTTTDTHKWAAVIAYLNIGSMNMWSYALLLISDMPLGGSRQALSIRFLLLPFEYQKHAFLRGFTSFQGWCNGVSGWMEASCAMKSLSRLPSREWSWVDSEWRLYEDGWTYADSIEEQYYASRGKKSKARRRRWQRLCRFECKGPWIPIEAPSIRSIDILVWAVTEDGQVLLRQGVTGERPQGTTWKHVLHLRPVYGRQQLKADCYDGNVLIRRIWNVWVSIVTSFVRFSHSTSLCFSAAQNG
ncbi:unnamed protein product [Haemonchus placei]|uniref:Peroxin/Ferlin domain-containing protein n=1 Tax=Haemonchus placei TaxID=6290 RepID=A0A0N4W5A6_HAEPC|nr:unnamed protein product [Haemonchus placei]